MAKLKVGFIGTAKVRERCGAMGYAMAYEHAEAYRKLDTCEMAACPAIGLDKWDACRCISYPRSRRRSELVLASLLR